MSEEPVASLVHAGVHYQIVVGEAPDDRRGLSIRRVLSQAPAPPRVRTLGPEARPKPTSVPPARPRRLAQPPPPPEPSSAKAPPKRVYLVARESQTTELLWEIPLPLVEAWLLVHEGQLVLLTREQPYLVDLESHALKPFGAPAAPGFSQDFLEAAQAFELSLQQSIAQRSMGPDLLPKWQNLLSLLQPLSSADANLEGAFQSGVVLFRRLKAGDSVVPIVKEWAVKFRDMLDTR